jgi:hypothetical protein
MGKRIGAYRVLTRRPDGKRPLVRHKRRWDGNIKINLQK